MSALRSLNVEALLYRVASNDETRRGSQSNFCSLHSGCGLSNANRRAHSVDTRLEV